MRHAIVIAVSFWVCGIPVNAAYDYVITEGYSTLPDLQNNETLLMTGGGGVQHYFIR